MPSFADSERAKRQAAAHVRVGGEMDFHKMIEDVREGKDVEAPANIHEFLEYMKQHPNDFEALNPPISIQEAKGRFFDYMYNRRYTQEMEWIARKEEKGIKDPFWQKHPILSVAIVVFVLWLIGSATMF